MPRSGRPAGPQLRRPVDPETIARRRRLAAARRERRISQSYSRVVAFLKIVLPVVAIGLMGTAVLWPYFMPERLETVEPPDERALRAGGSGEITAPQYFGTDDQGRPYEITAETARRIEGAGERYDITAPEARITLTDGTLVEARAGRGILDREAGVLLLSEGVFVQRADGTAFQSERAVVDLEGQVMTGDAPVTGQGPFGALSAGGFRVEDEGRVVVMTGPSRLDLESSAEENVP